MDQNKEQESLVLDFSGFMPGGMADDLSIGGRCRVCISEKTLMAFITMAQSGAIWVHIGYSLFRVITGFLLGLAAAIPIAFLMGWYKTVQYLLEPVVQFIRTIPPIAYIPLVIVALGVDESSKIMVIFIATFLVMVITIYQGVKMWIPHW